MTEALDGNTGAKKWNKYIGGEGMQYGQAMGYDGTLYNRKFEHPVHKVIAVSGKTAALFGSLYSHSKWALDLRW